MDNGDILVLKGNEIAKLLDGRELDLIDTVGRAYQAHANGASSLPHSSFLHFPDNPRNRIIALPAYLGDEFGVAGIKWVASFPSNIVMNLDRASATVILNSADTGRPEAILEGSIISAKRTAASAALAAQRLQDGRKKQRLGLFGCGLINFEIARFLVASSVEIESFFLFDVDEARIAQFKSKCVKVFPDIPVETTTDSTALYESCSLISFATTSIKPHVSDLSKCPPGSTILHISLRDLTAEVILSCDNIVDDIDHVCRAQTSVHLAEQLVGNRDFIRCNLAEILQGTAPARDGAKVAVFSPFGLGILDLAVAKLVRDLALEQGTGITIESFLPDSWADKAGVL